MQHARLQAHGKDLHVAWNVQYVVVFVPALDGSSYVPQPPSGKCQKRRLRKRDRGQIYSSPPGSRTQQPPGDLHQVQHKGHPNPCMALRLMIKEEALIISDQPLFPAVAEIAKRGLLFSRNVAMQPTARQPENLDRRTNARHSD